jgi:hypothetical protein
MVLTKSLCVVTALASHHSVNNQHAAHPVHSHLYMVGPVQVMPRYMCEICVCLTTDRPSPSAVLKDRYFRMHHSQELLRVNRNTTSSSP